MCVYLLWACEQGKSRCRLDWKKTDYKGWTKVPIAKISNYFIFSSCNKRAIVESASVDQLIINQKHTINYKNIVELSFKKLSYLIELLDY